ncbi:MAG: hypothetical protein FWD68_16040 [Alphaproteobacteria bacterium]|nr:hypothetical protein [Alphaproteobacteria bacterium]
MMVIDFGRGARRSCLELHRELVRIDLSLNRRRLERQQVSEEASQIAPGHLRRISWLYPREAVDELAWGSIRSSFNGPGSSRRATPSGHQQARISPHRARRRLPGRTDRPGSEALATTLDVSRHGGIGTVWQHNTRLLSDRRRKPSGHAQSGQRRNDGKRTRTTTGGQHHAQMWQSSAWRLPRQTFVNTMQ